MEKLKAWIKNNILIIILLLPIVGVVSLVVGIKVADLPAFCGVACHEMQYYTDSLKTSYHGNNSLKVEVICMDCHSEQGFINHTIEHVKASLLMGQHFTEGYKTDYLNKHAEIQAEYKRNKCQVCHPGRAAEAHFMEVPEHKYEMLNANCIRCHKNVPTGESNVEEVKAHDINPAHEHHAKNEVLCTKCHKLVVHGTDPQGMNFPSMHVCFSNCHDDKKAPRSDCGLCHTLAKKILTGEAGGVAATPGVMSNGVQCIDCHVEVSGSSKHEVATFKPDPQTCVNCHDASYKDKITEWQGKYQKRLQDVENAYNSLEIEKLSVVKQQGLGKILPSTRYNIDVIRMDKSHGVHNLDYINALADKILIDIKQINYMMVQK